ncbi:hypothetical protein VTH82DRAFT_586 [Thermothelomyces myriococcoides]
MQLVVLYGDWHSSSSRRIWGALEHLAPVAALFHTLTVILLFVTFVEIAGGYIICVNGPSTASLSRKFIRGVIFAWAFVLFTLTITQFGLNESLVARSRVDDDYTYTEELREKITLYRVAGVIRILSWLTTLPILGYGVFIVNKTKDNPFLRSGAILLLVCIILDILRHLIRMAIFIDFWLIDLAYNLDSGPNRPVAIWNIVEPFFDYTLMFVILIMLFSLGLRKRNGLWSQPPPEWSYSLQQVMFGQSYPAPQGYYHQPQPPQQQQQQHQQQELEQESKEIEPLVQQQEQQQSNV